MRKIKFAGIYKILHIPTGQYYIGMSVDIFSRWSSHYTAIKCTNHSSILFMNLWNSTEPTEWQFTILEPLSITAFKLSSGLRGKGLTNGFRKHLLFNERKWMSEYSITYALNKDTKYFS